MFTDRQRATVRRMLLAGLSGLLLTTLVTAPATAAHGESGASGGAAFGEAPARANAADVRLPAILERIAECESGSNPKAVSSNGLYRGKYQFHRSTWRSMGGKGDPARASEAEQDRRALRLYRQQGTAPWPVCGRS